MFARHALKVSTPVIAVIGLMLGAPTPSSATTLDFEDLSVYANVGNTGNVDSTDPSGACSDFVNGTYGGFTWSNGNNTLGDWGLQCDADYSTDVANGGIATGSANSTYSNTYGALSSFNAAFNIDGAQTVSLTRGTDFNFVGASFHVWTDSDAVQSYSAPTVTLQGYNNGGQVGSDIMVTLLPGSWIFQSGTGLGGPIDELRFIADAGNIGYSFESWLMDDFQFTDVVPEVPEPASLMLLGTGLLAVARNRSRARKRNG